MNRTALRTALALVIAAAASTATVSAQALAVKAKGARKVTLDDRVGKNQFVWSSDAPLEKIQGTAEGITGSLTIDPSNPTTIRGSISARVATMKSGNEMRDEHIRGESWLDATKYPEIKFTATSIANAKVNGNKLTASVTGDFSMHGVTKKVTIPITLQYMDATAKTKERAPGDLVMITAEFNVSLKDFNVAGSKGTVGSKVGESIAINAKLFGSTGR
jgi:polyisoprenoid-binding protein YceI